MRCYLFRGGQIAAIRVLADGSEGSVIRNAHAAFEERKREFDGSEVWHDARLTAQGERPVRMMLEQVVAHRQARAVELEEQIRDSRWAVASSKRLLRRLQLLAD